MEIKKITSSFPILKKKQIHIWQANLDISNKEQQKYIQILSEEERTKASKFYFSKDSTAYIAARGMLRTLSAKYFNSKAKDIKFDYGKFGKPSFAMNTSLKFNVSHSGNLVVIGFVLDYVMGTDVELIKDDFDIMDIGRRFFSKNEVIAINDMPKSMHPIAFYRCWTRKEAFIKAEGSGLSFPLDSFTTSIGSDTKASLLKTDWNPLERKKWELYPFIPKKNYRGAIAVRGKINSLHHYQWQH